MQFTQCPDHAKLSALKAGDLPIEEIEAMARHLDACASCQTTIEALDSENDTLLSALGLFLATGPSGEECECQAVVARAEAISPVQIRSEDIAKNDDAPPETKLLKLAQYELLDELGHGGMGTVYKARHTKLNRVVALKTLRADRMKSPEAVARFHREMEAIGTLDHPHIVRASDAGEADGIHFLVMEFVDGIDVGTLIRRHRQLPIADACEIVRQAAVGLEHVHEHGLVHRDIKPSNLLVTAGGQVKIADLGLVSLRTAEPLGDPLTEPGQILGTLDYLAPEQASHTHRVDIRADLYSLGCTLYQLLVGRPPFAAPQFPDAMKKMFAHAHEAARPVRELRPNVPELLAGIVQKLLAKNPADRYGTPAEVAAALQPFVVGADLRRLCSSQVAHEPTEDAVSGSMVVPTQVATSRSIPQWWRKLTPIALAVLLALATLPFAPTVYRIVTNQGIIVIKTDDPDVQVSVRRNGQEVAILDTRTNHQITVTAGVYEVRLNAGKETLKLKTGRFTLERNGREIVQVFTLPSEGAAPRQEFAAEAATQLPPVKPELLLNEDFDGPELAHEATDVSHFVRNGIIRIELTPNRQTYWFDQWNHDAAADIKIELRFRLYKHGIIWFFFRSTGDEHERSRLALTILPEGGYKLLRETLVPDPTPSGWRASKQIVLMESPKPAWSRDQDDEWNTIRVTAWQDVLRLEANDQPACEGLDRTWPPANPTPLPGVRLHATGQLTEKVTIELDTIRVWRLERGDLDQQPAPSAPADPNPPPPQFLRDVKLHETFDDQEWLKEEEFNTAGVRAGVFFREIAAGHAGLGYFDNWNFAAADNFECSLRYRLRGKAVLWIRFLQVGNQSHRSALWLGILPKGGWLLRRNFEDFADGKWQEVDLVTIDQNSAPAELLHTEGEWSEIVITVTGSEVQFGPNGHLTTVRDDYEPPSDFQQVPWGLRTWVVASTREQAAMELDFIRAGRLKPVTELK